MYSFFFGNLKKDINGLIADLYEGIVCRKKAAISKLAFTLLIVNCGETPIEWRFEAFKMASSTKVMSALKFCIVGVSTLPVMLNVESVFVSFTEQHLQNTF